MRLALAARSAEGATDEEDSVPVGAMSTGPSPTAVPSDDPRLDTFVRHRFTGMVNQCGRAWSFGSVHFLASGRGSITVHDLHRGGRFFGQSTHAPSVRRARNTSSPSAIPSWYEQQRPCRAFSQ